MSTTIETSATVTHARPRPAEWLRFITDLHNQTVFARVGNWVITTYAFLAGTAFLIGFTTALWLHAMAGHDVAAAARLHLLITMPAIFIGLRVTTILTELPDLWRRPLQTVVRPGYMLHGGIFGGAIGLLAVSQITGVRTLFYFDCAVMALTIGETIARIGCHVYGCCWGRPTQGRIGIRYTNPDASVLRNRPELAGVRLHPAQLYASMYSFALLLLVLWLLPFKYFDGMLAAVYCISHSIGRFGLEQLRNDNLGRIGSRWTHTNLYSAVLLFSGVTLFAFGTTLPNTPIDLTIGWSTVGTNPAVMRWVAAFGLFFFFVYGVHYKKVGAWVSSR